MRECTRVSFPTASCTHALVSLSDARSFSFLVAAFHLPPLPPPPKAGASQIDLPSCFHRRFQTLDMFDVLFDLHRHQFCTDRASVCRAKRKFGVQKLMFGSVTQV